jgi:hypothetical protein
MLIQGIDNSYPSPIWKKECPPSLLMVASNGSSCLVLCSIGPIIEYLEESQPLNEWITGSTFGPGIWIVEIIPNTYQTWTDYGYEYDVVIDYGEIRLATDEEVCHQACDEWPWDPELWMENWPEVRDWRTPVDDSDR